MSRRFHIPKDVVSEKLDGQAIALHLGSGKYFALNATASRMWDLLVKLDDISSVVEALASELDADEQTLRRDLSTLIAELEQRGLIARVP